MSTAADNICQIPLMIILLSNLLDTSDDNIYLYYKKIQNPKNNNFIVPYEKKVLQNVKQVYFLKE